MLLAGLGLAGATPALAHDTMPDCAVDPAFTDCVTRTGPSIDAHDQGIDWAALDPTWLPEGGSGQKPGHGT
jgi:hypothetical protein